MCYSAREHITKIVSGTASEIATDEMIITDILNRAYSRIVNNPALTTLEAVNLCFAD